jgi:putative NADPH-quinone reductase
MNVLLVYAHPNPRSFNQAILDMVDATLRDRGHVDAHPRSVSDAMPGGAGW